MKLPFFLTRIQDLSLMQTKWSGILNPFLSNISLQSIILPNVRLLSAVNPNVVSHKLEAKLTGWRIIRKRGQASIYDTQDSNQTPDLTLNLVTDTDVTIDLEVF